MTPAVRAIRQDDMCERCGELPAAYLVAEQPHHRPLKVCAPDCQALKRRGWVDAEVVST